MDTITIISPRLKYIQRQVTYISHVIAECHLTLVLPSGCRLSLAAPLSCSLNSLPPRWVFVLESIHGYSGAAICYIFRRLGLGLIRVRLAGVPTLLDYKSDDLFVWQ